MIISNIIEFQKEGSLLKKVAIIALTYLLLLSSIACASPLMDYEAGKSSIDLTWRNTKIDLSGYSSGHLPNKDNMDVGITFGLGNNFAFQYRNFEPKSDITRWNFNGIPTTGQFTLTSKEFNILYKLSKDVSAFGGVINTKGYRWTPINQYTTDARNLWQIGIVGQTSIAPKTNLWASAAGGTDLTNFETGVSYEFARNMEFNVSYRELETKNLKVNQYPLNVKATGWGYGITYKF